MKRLELNSGPANSAKSLKIPVGNEIATSMPCGFSTWYSIRSFRNLSQRCLQTRTTWTCFKRLKWRQVWPTRLRICSAGVTKAKSAKFNSNRLHLAQQVVVSIIPRLTIWALKANRICIKWLRSIWEVPMPLMGAVAGTHRFIRLTSQDQDRGQIPSEGQRTRRLRSQGSTKTSKTANNSRVSLMNWKRQAIR